MSLRELAVSLGSGSHGNSASGTDAFTVQSEAHFDYSSMHGIKLGLQGMGDFGGGFGALAFSVSKHATEIISQTLTLLPDARASRDQSLRVE